MKLASFDIFDTTLLRSCGKPEAVFHLLAERLFPNDKDLREAFDVWQISGHHEVGGKGCKLVVLMPQPILPGKFSH